MLTTQSIQIHGAEYLNNPSKKITSSGANHQVFRLTPSGYLTGESYANDGEAVVQDQDTREVDEILLLVNPSNDDITSLLDKTKIQYQKRFLQGGIDAVGR
ncbi:hypothetical protein DFA_10904 [Cavenderia fasciculata]|uniref:Uncharacterized protein n=1 Tax=Cavenderia fasciculata TaxID=261658 RepID=F4QBQ8_CACFS|nr:uncharacterized protein DFA_10904 [Cavenderia fasciculata]EGG14646.1 hypothetical protein DFA_10904 [Cavenderia fasciculata]|eukprot:XP_004351154.1 hypothetical protein DFA_10904 [Cavenderia fasciculata]